MMVNQRAYIYPSKPGIQDNKFKYFCIATDFYTQMKKSTKFKRSASEL